MSTLEKLFVQIFERKDRIINQLQQQADSYTQQLASRLLIDGITPPSWLLSPSSNSHSSDPNGLEKEKIISKLLLRPPRDSTRYSIGGGSMYFQSLVAGADINKRLSTATCIEAHAPKKTINSSNEPLVTHECLNNETVGSLDYVSELDDSAKSPQNETDARITSIYEAPDTSLARIQRSKSRQKARELRSSGKTTAKSFSSKEKRIDLSFTGDSKCKRNSDQVIQDISPPEAGKVNIVSGTTSVADVRDESGNDRTSHSGRLAIASGACEIEGNKISSTSDKKELDGCIVVEPACDSLQQSCHANGVTEGVNLPNVGLESYAGKKSISGKTQGTQSQNNFFGGRITRSKSSSQQTSGINKSSKLGTSLSCNPKCDVSISNKLSNAVETFEVVGDINADTQAICSNEGVLKPVIPSYMDMKESSLGAKHLKNTVIVLAKQLNFDEDDKCGLDEIFSSLSKKRKRDGLSTDHKSSCSFSEQQLPKENAMSRSPKTARVDIGLEMNKNPVVEPEHNPKFSLHDDTNPTSELVLSPKRFDNELDEETCSEKSRMEEDHASLLKMQTKEDDLSHKGKASAVGDFIPATDIKSACTSSLPKQGNDGIEDCLDKAVNKPEVDLGSSKSKEFEAGTNEMLSNIKLNSVKVHTWPMNQQIHVEDQPNCFSDSRNFRARIQREAIRYDLDTPENDEVICDFSERTGSFLDIQAAEEIVTEVNGDTAELNDTLKQPVSSSLLNGDAAVTNSDNFEINLPNWVSSYVSDDITPVYESFIIDEETGNADMEKNEDGIDFDTLEVPTTTIARASMIEQICRSASMQTPVSQFYGFMEDSRNHLQTIDSGLTRTDSIFPQQQKLDYGTPCYWQSKTLYSSPVGKFWERSASSSGSSEVQLSSNPDLTCFPIEENDELQENINPSRDSTEMKTERKENNDDVVVEIQEPPVESMKYLDNRYSSNSVTIDVSVPRTHGRGKQKPKANRGIKISRYEENRGSSIHTRASSRGNVSVSSKNKSSMKGQIPRLSQKEAKRSNNIVSNVKSFIPMVQQKQAAAVGAGKRDIKVKALEAAEAARRREEERENERKQKKEAMKIERARIGKENAKEMELHLKKQEQKKEAEIAAARKRQREEEEQQKQLAKKRKLAAEAQKNQKLKHVKNAAMAGTKKNSANPRQNRNADENGFKKQDNGLRIDKTLAGVVQQVALENHDVSTREREKSPVKVVPLNVINQENSYDISPYQCSDDDEDDEDDDDRPNKKFIPSWASKNRVAVVLPWQQEIDPESIFPIDSFCRMDEVLLPRRLQAQ